MLKISAAVWIVAGTTYRHGDAGATPYLSIESSPGMGELTLFFVGDHTTSSSCVECIDAMISALQDLRANALRLMAPTSPHPSDDNAAVPHDWVRTNRDLALHLTEDHHVDERLDDLLDVTLESLTARHRREHREGGQYAGVNLADALS